ncbi:gamma-secretase subunit Aph-1-like [Amblyomma americanum]
MTVSECVGCSLIAFGPSLAAFWLTVAGEPSRIIVFLLSAFFWLLSLLPSSIAWSLLEALFGTQLPVGVVTSVCFQECFRFLAFRTLRKAETVLSIVELVGGDDDVALSRYRTAFSYVSGLGFGAASAASSMLNLLADAAAGPGTSQLKCEGSPAPACTFTSTACWPHVPSTPGFLGEESRVNYVLYSATAAAFSLLHTLWSVVAFNALLFRRWCLLLFVPAAHLFASCSTTLSQHAHQDDRYALVPVATVATVLCLSAVTAFSTAGGSLRSLGACLIGLVSTASVPGSAEAVKPQAQRR